MGKISADHLTFEYENSAEPVFEDISFVIDTDWKLGLVGRNGKGKTTLLRLLSDELEYRGRIQASCQFDYFPYVLSKEQMLMCASDFAEELCPDIEFFRVLCELNEMGLDAELLYRPFCTLSNGEQTRILLCILFSRENYFLLIDEPTNHLDLQARELVIAYLQKKKGFILVSHDRFLLDQCTDHILALNRSTIEVEKGNFSSWWENKTRRNHHEQMENEKHQKQIGKLKQAARQTAAWARKNEGTKIGFDPIKEHDRFLDTRAHIGAKTKKLQSRVKNTEKRLNREIEQKEELLKDIEKEFDLKIMPLSHPKKRLMEFRDFELCYGEKPILSHFNFELLRGERILLRGKNGCGKSSLIKAILSQNTCDLFAYQKNDEMKTETNGKERTISGDSKFASNLIISYISQDTSFLRGTLSDFARKNHLDESILKSILRQMDFERSHFTRSMEDYSEGQKKKVLIAASLLTPAHVYIWDEPLNYIDIFSRMQIEKLLLKYQPTMLFVEHDQTFGDTVATKIINL